MLKIYKIPETGTLTLLNSLYENIKTEMKIDISFHDGMDYVSKERR